MKIRMGFITNSSSTNFLIISKEELTEDYLFKKLGFVQGGGARRTRTAIMRQYHGRC